MDPWSKVDYSRLIREALVVVEKLPEVDPPSRSWNCGGDGTERSSRKMVPSSRVPGRGVNMGQRGAREWPQGSRRPPSAASRGVAPPGRLEPWWTPYGSPSGLWKVHVR